MRPLEPFDRLSVRPGRAKTEIPVEKFRASMIKSSYCFFLGFLEILVVTYFYPLLDENAISTLELLLFFLFFALTIETLRRTRQHFDVTMLKKYLFSLVPAPAVLGALLFFNAVLDPSPAVDRQTQIVQKSYSGVRVGTSYHLIVSSWRPGKKEENLAVSSRTFNRVHAGEAVTVEVHKGLLGLSWFSRILPR